jgi:hypothetical protein
MMPGGVDGFESRCRAAGVCQLGVGKAKDWREAVCGMLPVPGQTHRTGVHRRVSLVYGGAELDGPSAYDEFKGAAEHWDMALEND